MKSFYHTIGNLLSLRSSSNGAQWSIDPKAARTVEYLNVKDSNNTNLLNIQCVTGCVDSQNNTKWIFSLGVSGNRDLPILNENPLSINNGAKEVIISPSDLTLPVAVTLYFNVGNTYLIILSNYPDFRQETIIPYTSETQWSFLALDKGAQTDAVTQEQVRSVYAKFISLQNRESMIVKDDIILKLSTETPPNRGSVITPFKHPEGLKEGDLIRGPDGIKVYIINDYGYKRHIFNPAVFNMYRHFSWNDIKEATQQILDLYTTSDLYRAFLRPEIYQVNEINEAKGLAAKRHLNMTAQQFLSRGYKPEQVFTINEEENTYYQQGEDIL